MPKNNQKTCWSVVKNLFSFLASREFILGYLCISNQFLKVTANSEVRNEVYFTNGMKKSHKEPSDVCIYSSPGCLLSARGIFSESGARQGFEVGHLCSDDADFWKHLDALPLAQQIENDRYYGTKLCDGTLENKDQSTYPIYSRKLSDTDYRVNFDKADRVTISYEPRLKK